MDRFLLDRALSQLPLATHVRSGDLGRHAILQQLSKRSYSCGRRCLLEHGSSPSQVLDFRLTVTWSQVANMLLN